MAQKGSSKKNNQSNAQERSGEEQAILDAAHLILARGDATPLSADAVAAEADMSVETVNALFPSTNDMLLALAAHDLTALAREPENAGKSAETATAAAEGAFAYLKREEAKISLPGKAPAMSEELSGLLQDITSHGSGYEGGAAAAVVRLERRIFLLERAITEHAERQVQDAKKSAEVTLSTDGKIGDFDNRVERMESRLTSVRDDTNKGLKELAARLAILEAIPPAKSDATKTSAADADEQVPKLVQRGPEALDNDDSERFVMPPADTPLLEFAARQHAKTRNIDFLADARQAAIETAALSYSGLASPELAAPEVETGPQTREHAQVPLQLFDSMAPNGIKRIDGRFVATRIAPLSLALIIGLVVLGRGFFEPAADQQLRATETTSIATVTDAPLDAELSGPGSQAPTFEDLIASARAGNPHAETIAGISYLTGDGVNADEAQAVMWLQRAAEHGQAIAQYSLATFFGRQDTPTSDPSSAIRWYEAAAEQGNRMAMNNLAVFYAEGRGADRDIETAAHWFAQAAALDFEVAQFNLAVLFERGDGVPQDLGQAYKWYAIAAAKGDKDATIRAEALASRLASDALIAAHEAAETFTPEPLDAGVNFAPRLQDWQG